MWDRDEVGKKGERGGISTLIQSMVEGKNTKLIDIAIVKENIDDDHYQY